MQRSLEVENRTRRWREQRWLLDTVLKTVGPEWDQARIQSKGARGGPQGLADFRGAGARMKKFNDIGPEFGRAGIRREGIARVFEDQGRLVSARDSYLIAALLYASAQWPYFEINDECLEWERRMVASYDKYIQYAPHPVERVDIPFQDTALSAFLHLPHAPGDGETRAALQHAERVAQVLPRLLEPSAEARVAHLFLDALDVTELQAGAATGLCRVQPGEGESAPDGAITDVNR